MNTKLAAHIVSMADDAYFTGHPEWESIVEEAKEIIQPEPGAAQICIRLSDSEIDVFHTNEDGAILFNKKAVKGDWDKIWDAIKS